MPPKPEALSEARWATLMERLRLPRSVDTFERLQAAYAEKHRRYHTSDHINHCLAELDGVRDDAERPDEVELALWFHDAIYATRASDNEKRSADWAADFLAEGGAEEATIERVRALIMATTHDAAPSDPDAMLLVDVDLSILGADRETYGRFEDNVRKEYSWVPGPLFRRTRAKILQSFLDRPSVYGTARMRERLEDAARENLREAIARLRVTPFR
jgi:predicted metal-dependent HD superfamily phosphohydrolase